MAESAPLRPSILAPLVIWFLVLCASCFIMLGEMVWLMFVLWLPWFVWTRLNSRAAMVVGVLCVVILIAHFRGHQVIGSPRVVANRPFQPEIYITVLGPGTTVMLSDGRSFQLSGLTEKLTTDGRGALGPSWGIASRDKKTRRRAVSYDIRGGVHDNVRWSNLDERLNLWETEDGIPVQIKDEGNGSAQMTVGRGGNSWCGNSFFPTFFPHNLPRFLKTDLGLLLIRTGAVEPDGTARDAAYQAQVNAAHQNFQAAFRNK